jgi:glutathione S-transferase
MAPKPDLVPLTGGHRRIPVMQLGADVYVDTSCIARRLERLRPEPACLHEKEGGMVAVLEDWADHRFTFQCVPAVIVAMLPSLPPGILEDRAAMSPAFSRDALVAGAPHAWSQALRSMDRLERVLGERPFLAGETFSIADAAVYHPLWFLRHGGELFDAVGARPALSRWFARIEAFGEGEVVETSPAEALAVAREATPEDLGGESVADAACAPGDGVAIAADDYGTERTTGVVARITAEEITITRRDAVLGDLAVHFPRTGYRILPAP